MDDRLQDWIDEVYRRVSADVKQALSKGKRETDLIIIGEQHIDDSEQSKTDPAVASSYVQIAALEAARVQVGAENIVLSVELPESLLPQIINEINASNGIPSRLAGFPNIHTLDYALRNGIAIQASDPLSQDSRATGEERERGMIESIASLASRSDAPRLVVHVGGALHLSGLMEVSEESRDPISERRDSRLERAFGDVKYYNTTRAEVAELQSIKRAIDTGVRPDLEHALREHSFFTNPNNGISQFDAPEYANQNFGNSLRVINAARTSMGMEPLKGALSLEERLVQQGECLKNNPKASEGACAHFFNPGSEIENPLPALKKPKIIQTTPNL